MCVQKQPCNHDVPFALMIDHEFEYTMTVRHSEGRGVLPGSTFDRWEGGANEGVEHRELKLKVLQSGIGLPFTLCGVPFRDVGAEFLFRSSARKTRQIW